MKRVLIVAGTRPEAIKLAPVVHALESHSRSIETVLGLTGQHESLLTQVVDTFGLEPDFNLRLMRPDQALSGIASRILSGLAERIRTVAPDMVLVQGDTTTAFMGALASFYEQIPVGHIEAGLRTEDRRVPFPEEIHRRLVDVVSSVYFVPTSAAADNLRQEGIPLDRIVETGNTVVDAVLRVAEGPTPERIRHWRRGGRGLVLVTAHRRENFGEPMERVFQALRTLAERFSEYHFIYPVHPNPAVRDAAHADLNGISNVTLTDSLPYTTFVHLIKEARLVLTDSGGIQEEAPSFDSPVVVLREETERMELIDAGAGVLVGTNADRIVEETSSLLEDEERYRAMADVANPFGDGTAAKSIADVVAHRLGVVDRSNVSVAPPC